MKSTEAYEDPTLKQAIDSYLEKEYGGTMEDVLDLEKTIISYNSLINEKNRIANQKSMPSIEPQSNEGTGNTYLTLEQMKSLGWSKIHCGYVTIDTGEDSPLNDMTSEIGRKYRDLNQGDIDKINTLFDRYQINTKKRIAAFFAECSAETANGTRFLEGAGTRKNPFVGSVTRTNLNRWFDTYKDYGSKYRGGGAIQLTWDYHYDEFEKWMSADFGITDTNITNKGAEYVAMNYTWEAAVFYWSKSNLNSKADTGDIHKVTEVVNKYMTDGEYRIRKDAYDLWIKDYTFPY